MARNFRKRSFTKRTTNISQAQIERLRATRLKNAKNYKQTKFFSSKQFDKQLRANVRSNRAKANIKTLDKIVKQIGGTKDQEKITRAIFGESSKLVKGKVVRKNTFTSQAQTKRLKKVQMNIKKKKFNFKYYLNKSKQFKEVKKYLPEGADTSDIVYVLSRGQFYLENKRLIQKHNRNVSKYGFYDAQTRAEGKSLRNKHYESQNQEGKDFIDFLENK